MGSDYEHGGNINLDTEWKNSSLRDTEKGERGKMAKNKLRASIKMRIGIILGATAGLPSSVKPVKNAALLGKPAVAPSFLLESHK
jgi:hypothetical protein